MGKTELIAEPGQQEFFITRMFDAPRELVFKAHTAPDLMRQWMGPRGLTNVLVEMDARPGGSWRFVHADADGNEYGFRGVLHDVVAPERIVRTFEFDGVPGHVSLETLTLEAQGSRTKLTAHAVYQSVADRDGMISSGMEDGMNEGYERLDELLKELQRSATPAR